jgi:hypothetical protein
MSLIRAIIGALVGNFILMLEFWPVFLLSDLVPEPYGLPAAFLLTGATMGVISGSSIWGAVSGIFLLGAIYSYWTHLVNNLNLGNFILLIIGGFLGGMLYKSFSGKEDYVLLKIKK